MIFPEWSSSSAPWSIPSPADPRRGNPQARNMFEILAYLQQAEGVRFEVRSTNAASRAKPRRSSRRNKTPRILRPASLIEKRR
jgi:hypothetical protein